MILLPLKAHMLATLLRYFHSQTVAVRSLFITIAIVTTMTGTLSALRIPPVQHFRDVPSTHPNFAAIEYLREKNVLWKGIGEEFHPDKPISRSEFVYMITNPIFLSALRRNDCVQSNPGLANGTVYFTDVPRKEWYAQAVCLAKVKMLVDGYPDRTFQPKRSINFAEAAKIIVNTFRAQREPEDLLDPVWYRPYVQHLEWNNAIPTSVRTLSERVTRGEVAEILFRLKVGAEGKQTRRFNELERAEQRLRTK